MNPTDLIDQRSLRDDVPDFAPGDTLKVHVRVVEGNRERVQVFQGAVIRRQGDGIRETFTVRKVSFGVGVERTFPVHSPIIAKIEVVTRGDVRRAKLYYLRDRVGKAAKIKEKTRLSRRRRRARWRGRGSGVVSRASDAAQVGSVPSPDGSVVMTDAAPGPRRARRGMAAAGTRHGYEVVARNWRCRDGEIDLIVRQGARSCSAR